MSRKIATGDLKMANGTVAYYAGDEVPEATLSSDMAKAYGWNDLVASEGTKAAESAKEAASESLVQVDTTAPASSKSRAR